LKKSVRYVSVRQCARRYFFRQLDTPKVPLHHRSRRLWSLSRDREMKREQLLESFAGIGAAAAYGSVMIGKLFAFSVGFVT
jgi:hypothetical protein